MLTDKVLVISQLKNGFQQSRKWNWAAIEGTCAEELYKGTGKQLLPPETQQEGEEEGHIWRL